MIPRDCARTVARLWILPRHHTARVRMAMARACIITTINVVLGNRQQRDAHIRRHRQYRHCLCVTHERHNILQMALRRNTTRLGGVLPSWTVNLLARNAIDLSIGLRLNSTMAITRIRRHRAARPPRALRPTDWRRATSRITRARHAAYRIPVRHR